MNRIRHLKQEHIFISTKSLNKYPNIKAQTSDENQPIESFENGAVVFDDTLLLLSKQESIIGLFFFQEDVLIKMIFTTYLKAIFIYQKYYS